MTRFSVISSKTENQFLAQNSARNMDVLLSSSVTSPLIYFKLIFRLGLNDIIDEIDVLSLGTSSETSSAVTSS